MALPVILLLLAQTFDVASVKPMSGPGHWVFETTPMGITFLGIPLGPCIRWAYGFDMYQRYQTAGPDWLESGPGVKRYDIMAKAGHSVSTTELRLMLRALLAERWKLEMHREMRTMPVYVLSVGKDGPKLKPSETEGDPLFEPSPDGWTFKRTTMASLTSNLSQGVTRLIVDETKLEGRYDFTLDLAKYADYSAAQPGGIADGGAVLNKALAVYGLRLLPERRPVEVLVIDRADPAPTEN